MAQTLDSPRGHVVLWTSGNGSFGAEHERATRRELGRRLAALKGYEYSGGYDAAIEYGAPLYFVPADTLRSEDAAVLGITSAQQLLGGVVPHRFIATKAITHGLVDAGAARPQAWVERFGEAVQDATLPGFSAFAPADAKKGGRRLLALGDVRIKVAGSAGGKDQWVVADAKELERRLDALDAQLIAGQGVVLEQNLSDPVVHSIGQVRLDDIVASYHGVQRETRNNRGASIYGGSDLHVVRGGFDELLAQPLAPGARRAVEQAHTYHEAVKICYPGFFASRINYDVVEGRDASGKPCGGVLEQSWRIGGATTAEIAALERLHQDAHCNAVHVSCVEAYGGGGAPPPGAIIFFHGDDPDVGPIAKYALVHSDAHST